MNDRTEIVRHLLAILTEGRSQSQISRRVVAMAILIHGPEYFQCRSVEAVARRFKFSVTALYREIIDAKAFWENPASVDPDE